MDPPGAASADQHRNDERAPALTHLTEKTRLGRVSIRQTVAALEGRSIRSLCLAIALSITSRLALVHSTVRPTPSSSRVPASKPSFWRDFRVLPTRRPARSHGRGGVT